MHRGPASSRGMQPPNMAGSAGLASGWAHAQHGSVAAGGGRRGVGADGGGGQSPIDGMVSPVSPAMGGRGADETVIRIAEPKPPQVQIEAVELEGHHHHHHHHDSGVSNGGGSAADGSSSNTDTASAGQRNSGATTAAASSSEGTR